MTGGAGAGCGVTVGCDTGCNTGCCCTWGCARASDPYDAGAARPVATGVAIGAGGSGFGACCAVRIALPFITTGGRRCASGSAPLLEISTEFPPRTAACAASARGFANGITFCCRCSTRGAAGLTSTDVRSASVASRRFCGGMNSTNRGAMTSPSRSHAYLRDLRACAVIALVTQRSSALRSTPPHRGCKDRN